MCGIAGYYNSKLNQDQIRQIIASLKHRGPDADGFFVDDQVGLFHTRLSVLELTELGSQPYQFNDLTLVYNGEVYNYKEVRQKLKSKGYTFQSNSDTEVIIKAFDCWRENCVLHFVGMFAFALYEKSTHTLWLFRDRVGVKPLYYTQQNNSLFFASELKALIHFNPQSSVSQSAVFDFFRFGFIGGSQSIYESVYKLEAGCFIKISEAGLKKKRYWDLPLDINHSKTEKQWVEELEESMISAFSFRMISDVPVGVFLSGGMDSSLLSAVLKKHYGPIHSFTIGFEEPEFDESAYARQVAGYLNIQHTEKTLQLLEARSILNDFYSIYDEPFSDTSGIPTYAVTQLAKEKGIKVVLSADGGDELFGGYPHYRRTKKLFETFSRLPAGLRNKIGRFSGFAIPDLIRENIYSFNVEHRLAVVEELMSVGDSASFFETMVANQTKDEIRKLFIDPPAKEASTLSKAPLSIEKMMEWDFRNFLPDDLMVKIDRATMFHGVECREPFLDHRLVEMAMQIPVSLRMKGGQEKYLEKKILESIYQSIFCKEKRMGFSIPIFKWFRKDMDNLFSQHFTDERLREVPFLNAMEVKREYKKYQYYKSRNRDYNMEKMWRLLSFMLWWDSYRRS
ncbi:MAG: asparagine synthase (glutamine-hydrolyzing) [Flammeovirgaceae bacterium]|nr:asparagine synthase (glutamine-hydrolyzing) [Flammeovirgaceae bacterium]